MMTFLKLCRPLDQRSMWTQYVENRVKEDGPDGAKLLRVSLPLFFTFKALV